MKKLPNWNISQDSARRLSGLPAWRTLTALQLAADSDEGPKRDRFLTRAQDALRALDARRPGKLSQRFQTRLLALQGRGGDDEIAHAVRFSENA